MGRIYTVTFEEVSISVAQDLFELYFPSSTYKALRILRQWLECSDTTLPTAIILPLRSRVLPSAVTNGSGGTSANIGKGVGDSSASFTAKANNTTKATTTGTPSIEYEGGFHVYQGHEWMFTRPPIIIGGSGDSFVFELLGVPASAVKFSGGLEVEEMG